MTDDHQAVYVLRNDVAIEEFGDNALVFQAADCRLVGINHSILDMLGSLDGKRNVHEVAKDVAKAYGTSFDDVLEDVVKALGQLESERVLKLRCEVPLTFGRTGMSADERYMVNPDVSCRIEDEDGAILYNPDTDGVQVINTIGLELWETLSVPRDLSELVAHIEDVCRDIPENEAAKDVKEFVTSMVQKGYIGVVE